MMLPFKESQWPSGSPVFSPMASLSSQEIGAGQWDQLLPMEMVDTESPIGPLSPLEADDLESPLSADFLQEMGTIQEISQSIGEDSSGSFSFTEYQYLGSGPGSDGSVITGKRTTSWKALLRNVFSAENSVRVTWRRGCIFLP